MRRPATCHLMAHGHMHHHRQAGSAQGFCVWVWDAFQSRAGAGDHRVLLAVCVCKRVRHLVRSQLLKAAIKYRDEYGASSHLVAPVAAPKPTATAVPAGSGAAPGREGGGREGQGEGGEGGSTWEGCKGAFARPRLRRIKALYVLPTSARHARTLVPVTPPPPRFAPATCSGGAWCGRHPLDLPPRRRRGQRGSAARVPLQPVKAHRLDPRGRPGRGKEGRRQQRGGRAVRRGGGGQRRRQGGAQGHHGCHPGWVVVIHLVSWLSAWWGAARAWLRLPWATQYPGMTHGMHAGRWNSLSRDAHATQMRPGAPSLLITHTRTLDCCTMTWRPSHPFWPHGFAACPLSPPPRQAYPGTHIHISAHPQPLAPSQCCTHRHTPHGRSCARTCRTRAATPAPPCRGAWRPSGPSPSGTRPGRCTASSRAT